MAASTKKTPTQRHLKKVIPVKSAPKTVRALKKQYQDLPLHFLFGINKEIEEQCPILDEYLDQLKEIEATLRKIRNCRSLEMAQLHAAEALHQMDTLPEGIDKVTRTNFEKLRFAHGQWKNLAIEAIDDTQQPIKYLKI